MTDSNDNYFVHPDALRAAGTAFGSGMAEGYGGDRSRRSRHYDDDEPENKYWSAGGTTGLVSSIIGLGGVVAAVLVGVFMYFSAQSCQTTCWQTEKAIGLANAEATRMVGLADANASAGFATSVTGKDQAVVLPHPPAAPVVVTPPPASAPIVVQVPPASPSVVYLMAPSGSSTVAGSAPVVLHRELLAGYAMPPDASSRCKFNPSGPKAGQWGWLHPDGRCHDVPPS